MHWKVGSNGAQYLYATNGRREKSLGTRSEKTEAIMAAHALRVAELKELVEKTSEALDRDARVSKALYLGRVPTIAARILRKIDEEGLLDGQLKVAGTNALYAYEVGTGVLLGQDLIATEDLDLLRDPRKSISILLSDSVEKSVLGLLRQVDRSFTKRRPYQAINSDSYIVDLIRPQHADEMFRQEPRLSQAQEEFEPAAIEGLEWLVNAPSFEDIAIAEDGLPVRIVTIDPRAYALHKVWLSRRPNREALKRTRDLAQAQMVAELAAKWLALRFDDDALTALPVELIALASELQKAIP